MKSMIQRATLVVALVAVLAAVAEAAGGSTLYIAPQNGFETYTAGAVTKKHVPVTMTDDPAAADYALKLVEEAHYESGASKIARCLFAYCIGIDGSSTASVQLIDKDHHIVWAYEVKKVSR